MHIGPRLVGLTIASATTLSLVVAMMGPSGSRPTAAGQVAPPQGAAPIGAAKSPPWSPPSDVSVPDAIKGNPLRQLPLFDEFSWRTFIALNWPAVSGRRGVADDTKSLGDPSDAVVWETWKAAYDLFQPDNTMPSAWDSYEGTFPCSEMKGIDPAMDKILAMFAQGEDINQAGFGTPVGPLAAQNKTYTRYEIRLNQPEYEYIAKNEYYLRENLPLARDPAAQQLDFPDGSMEIKAAWRVLESTADLTRFYHRRAIVQDPVTKQCQQQTVGLVGLHIIRKTPTRPQWIWSTFEHVDNVALGVDAPDGIKPSFNDPDGSQQDPPAGPKVINIIPRLPSLDPKAVQVVRLKPVHESTERTNAFYREKLARYRGPWRHYRLVMTQWPTDPGGAEASGRSFPNDQDKAPEPNVFHTKTSVANITMETFSPLQTNTSCMGCHFAPKLYKVGPVWFLAVQATSRVEAIQAAALKNASDVLNNQADSNR